MLVVMPFDIAKGVIPNVRVFTSGRRDLAWRAVRQTAPLLGLLAG
jgi:hypothetical protein